MCRAVAEPPDTMDCHLVLYQLPCPHSQGVFPSVLGKLKCDQYNSWLGRGEWWFSVSAFMKIKNCWAFPMGKISAVKRGCEGVVTKIRGFMALEQLFA